MDSTTLKHAIPGLKHGFKKTSLMPIMKSVYGSDHKQWWQDGEFSCLALNFLLLMMEMSGI